LLLPFISRASNITGKRILLIYEKNNFLLNFDKTIFFNGIKSNNIVSKTKEISIEFLKNNNSFSAKDWNELNKLSKQTFVEERESLKNEAAGAGLLDND